jgi:hypothetical protein
MAFRYDHDRVANICPGVTRALAGVFRGASILTAIQLPTHGTSVAVYSIYSTAMLRTYAIQARVP